jgi:hypothetical protein
MAGPAALFGGRMTADAIRTRLCVRRKADLSRKLSTVIKVMVLDGWVMDCDGKEWETRATPLERKIINSFGGGGTGGKNGGGGPGKNGGGGTGNSGGGGSGGLGGLLGALGGLFGFGAAAAAPPASTGAAGKMNYAISGTPLVETLIGERVVQHDSLYARILAEPHDEFDAEADRMLEKHLDEILEGVDLTTRRMGSARERRGEALNSALMEAREQGWEQDLG